MTVPAARGSSRTSQEFVDVACSAHRRPAGKRQRSGSPTGSCHRAIPATAPEGQARGLTRRSCLLSLEQLPHGVDLGLLDVDDLPG